MTETRVIKRYANRKLYDTQRSRYVTLDQIADMIRCGEDVKIVDNNSKEDLTSVTLAQIIFEEEKKRKSFLPLAAMRNIIQSGGESLQELASQAGARVRSVLRLGDPEGEGGDGSEADAGKEALATAEPPASPAPALNGTEAPSLGPGNMVQTAVREFLERSQQTFDEWQKRVDERVHKVVEALAPWTVLQKDLKELQERLSDLEKRLSDQETD
ncbi:MAG TPA: polyhydroxyalkanoate synthesis regulator DNA-binding domain-containing protein [Polyangia bacterium]|jgi:polyhydroxyalkanoate synthesis repressor PhaR|nr:polyhydroxyalkanoate synthesis regulator DNA-binding domain-containing protein [Polyangia bacterium]